MEEKMGEIVKALLEQMKPMFEMMSGEEFCSTIGKMYWNIYKAFKEKGFTEEQAIQLLSRMNFGK